MSITPHGRGLINDSYLVRLRNGAAFLLQRLNPKVFPDPELPMHNLRVVGRHIAQKRTISRLSEHQAILPLPVRHQAGDCCYDDQGACWRALNFIDHSRTISRLTGEEQAGEVGAALGRFHCLLNDLPPARLRDPLPTFHVTPWVLARYQATLSELDSNWEEQFSSAIREKIEYCRAFIAQRRESCEVLEQARARGVLPERVIHGDPKLDNFLFAADADRALALIDLDTVKPGLTQYDIGDCLRSCCNLGGEDPAQPSAARFDLDLAWALLTGYLGEMRALLTYNDFAYFYEATRLISFELGLRFFRDFLVGNRYFKVTDPEQNLRRALAQFNLTASIEEQAPRLRAMINELTW